MIADLMRELWQSACAASVAILLVLALRRPMRRWWGAQAAYATWSLVPLLILAVWLPASPQAAAPWVGSIALGQPLTALTAPSASAGLDANVWLLALWLAGTAVALAVFAVRQRRFDRRIRRQPDQAFDLVDGHGPALVGWWRARVVLPRDFRQRYDADEQRMVLAHEHAHRQRGDLQVQTLAMALRCLYWFNPLLHYAGDRFRFDQELACDATVLAQFPHQRRHYGAAMLKTQLADFGLPLGCHWQSSHPLKERIAMLKLALPTAGRRRSGTVLVAALLALASYAAWATQPARAVVANDGVHLLTRLSGDDDVSPPVYPAAAKAAGVSGKLVVEVLVGTDHLVKDVRVVSAEPAGVFDQAAIAAARKWRLHPVLEHGQPVQRWVRVQLQFAPDPVAPASAATGAPAPTATPSTPELTLSPRNGGLRTRVGEIEVNSAPPVLDTSSRVAPHYPAAALANKQGGSVLLKVLVDARGAVASVQVEQSQPAGVFDQAAIDAARLWRFEPGRKDGKPAQYWIRMPIRFDPGA
jgi:TonB family protein